MMSELCCEACLYWRDENDLEKDLDIHQCDMSFEETKASDSCNAWSQK